MSLRDHATDAAIGSLGNKVIATGTTTVAVGWLTLNNLVAIGGLLIALAGFIVTMIYKVREDRRDAERHALEIERLRRGMGPAIITPDQPEPP